jgi:hypothetical protein
LDLRGDYLAAALELEAPPATVGCESCKHSFFEYRCQDCFPCAFICRSCCLKNHRNQPFHKIEKWNGKCFIPADLLSLGLVLHLGHQGNICPAPNSEKARAALRIIHPSGVHIRHVQYCECKDAPNRAVQLFRHRLFPATFEKPETAFTFSVLDHFYIDAMECKTSASSFFTKLKRLTSNAFPQDVPVSLFSSNANAKLSILILRIEAETSCESLDNGVTCRLESGLDGDIPPMDPQATETLLFSAPPALSLE